MTRTRTLPALFLVTSLFALGAAAQTAEFGRASGGSIDAMTKSARKLSGSLSLSQSSGLFRGQGYEGTLGGELLHDRLWFFAAASVLPRVQFGGIDASLNDAKAGEAKIVAQPVDWTNVTASFTQFQQPLLAAPDASVPSSFLSLRSTSMLSDRMMLNLSFSRSTATPLVTP